MNANKYLFVISLLVLAGCNSERDDVNITNNYITEIQAITPENNQNLIGDFELKTAIETDFFVVAKEIDSLEFYYSNSNVFHFDKDGYLVNNSGFPLMVFPVNPDGSSSSVSISTSQQVQINYSMGSPEATDRVDISINLPQNSGELPANEFDKQDPLTFNHSTSLSVFDSLGDVHILTFYFIHVNNDSNTWEFRVALDDTTVQPTIEQVLDFNSNGSIDLNDDDLDGFTTTGNGLIENINILLNNGADDLNITLDFTSETTSYNSNFEVSSLDATGFYTGHLKEFRIESNGLITLSYTNGEDDFIGRVAFAKFSSPYNLKPLDNSLWEETEGSGTPTYGEAETSNRGSIIPVVHDF
ncbi:flagellar hook-basal body complex protein [Thalassotalea sp. G2M2-11]|uniref:flagellar hook-basal body complex protein n=1 Tax=Thalassotalea sp. G2M2-11 TaxID=2787627 RepID=UPI0019D0C837|nr:flagellar hook-basal body complex protein [Thalassotalea sp. G2M2-11]